MRRFVIFLVLSVAISSTCSAESKYALLIGIDKYSSPSRPPVKVEENKDLGPSRFQLPVWPDLDGAVNDVNAMRALLTGPKFGFPANSRHLNVIKNGEATKSQILAAMKKYLVDDPAPGDVAVFYFAGHGSMRFNSKTEKRTNLLDNTIVPADANTGVTDIRDREVARIFNAALDKGVRLTAIFDSCHSGTIARGIPVGTPAKKRFLAYDPRDIAQGPDMKNGVKVVAPEDRTDNPALVFAAAQPEQFASEYSQNGEAHGAFTVALLQALELLPSETPAIDVFRRVKVVMDAMGLVSQQPVLAGQARQNQPLFGIGTGSNRLRLAVVSADDGVIKLDGGFVNSLAPGTELSRIATVETAGPLTIRLSRLDGFNQSEAEVLSPKGGMVEVGDLFEVTKFVSNPIGALPLWMPPANLSSQQLQQIAAELKKARDAGSLSLVADPTAEFPSHYVAWNGTQWIIQQVGSAKAKPLGPGLTAGRLAAAVPPGAKVYVSLPLAKEVAEEIDFARHRLAAAYVSDPGNAMYLLSGTPGPAGISYSWLSRSAISAAQAAGDSACSADSSYPVRSAWVSIEHKPDQDNPILDYARRLARIHSWLTLPSHDSGDQPFPFRLALRRSDGQIFSGAADTLGGDVFELILKTDREPVGVASRYVYVLGIDCFGQGKLLFPLTRTDNLLPASGSTDTEIPLRQGFRVGPPFGIDTYVLLTTSTPLADPSELNFDAARGARGASPLDQLLSDASAGTRGFTSTPTPSEWSIEYLRARSRAKDAGRPESGN